MRDDLIGALQSALARGESLNRAMMTLYNAGYSKQEIEESASALQQASYQQQLAPQKSVQNISNYASIKPKIKLILIIAGLLILLGALIGVILFREELIESFNNLLR